MTENSDGNVSDQDQSPTTQSPNVFEPSPKAKEIRKKLIAFMEEHIIPNEKVYIFYYVFTYC